MNFVSKIGSMPDFFKSEKFEPVNKARLLSFENISIESLCYIISGFRDYDDLVMSFAEAINNPNFGGSGTILYDFKHNKLLYHEELYKGVPTVYYASVE